MAKVAKTSIKRPKKPFKGAVDGKPFDTVNQPTPQQKKEGWEKWRAKKMLTQSIIKQMSGGKNLDDYVKSLINNAKMGNAKAIETINRGLEDDTIKSEVTMKLGKDLSDERYI